MTSSRRHLVALGVAFLVTVASTGIVLVALDLASGEQVRRDGTCCDVEFLDHGVLQLTWLLFPVVGLAGWLSVRGALVAVLGLTVPQWLAQNEVVGRYDRSGWGDGLEVLGYAVPLGVLVLSLVMVAVGGLLGRARRARLTTSRR